MGLEWREALSVDRGVIDTDHRRLIELINDVERTVTANGPIAELRAEIESLAQYTRQHFAREEGIMLERRYVKYDEHKGHHIDLIEQLNEVAQPVRAIDGGDAEVVALLGQPHLDKLIHLLRHWLIDHIIKEDLKMKPQLFAAK